MRRNSGARKPGDLIKTIFISALLIMLILGKRNAYGKQKRRSDEAEKCFRQDQRAHHPCAEGGKQTGVFWILDGG